MNKENPDVRNKILNSTIFPETLQNILESVIPHNGKMLYYRYITLINDFRLDQNDRLGVDAGKFIEEFVKAIAFKEGLDKVFNSTHKKSLKSAIDKIINYMEDPEEKKLMLNVAYHSIYRLRNKRDAAHINKTPISTWDARHIIETATWLLQELVRIYTNLSIDEINKLFYPFSFSFNYLKTVEFIGDKTVPLVENIGYKEQVLLVLLSKEDCLRPKDIKRTLPNIKTRTVYNVLYELSRNNLVVRIGDRNGCYKITSKGVVFIFEKINSLNGLNEQR